MACQWYIPEFVEVDGAIRLVQCVCATSVSVSQASILPQDFYLPIAPAVLEM